MSSVLLRFMVVLYIFCPWRPDCFNARLSLHTGVSLCCQKQEAALLHGLTVCLPCPLPSSDGSWQSESSCQHNCLSKAVSPWRQQDKKGSFENGRWNWCNCLKHFAFLLKFTGFDEPSFKRICLYIFFTLPLRHKSTIPRSLSHRKLHSRMVQQKHFLTSICQNSVMNV